jgi:hypothetical protein
LNIKKTAIKTIFVLFSIAIIIAYYYLFPETGDSVNTLIQNIFLYLIACGLWVLVKTERTNTENIKGLMRLQTQTNSALLDPVLIRLRTKNISTNNTLTGKMIDFVNVGASITNISISAEDNNTYKLLLNGHYQAKSLSSDPGADIIRLPGKAIGEKWEGRISMQKLTDVFQSNEKVYFTLDYTNRMGHQKQKLYCYSEQQANFYEVKAEQVSQ